MENKRTDCEAINPDIVNKVMPDMPDVRVLYDLSDFFKVMGDSTRIRLLWALEEAGMCVNDLAVLLDMTKSAVSHQLKILRTAKLVKQYAISGFPTFLLFKEGRVIAKLSGYHEKSELLSRLMENLH